MFSSLLWRRCHYTLSSKGSKYKVAFESQKQAFKFVKNLSDPDKQLLVQALNKYDKNFQPLAPPEEETTSKPPLNALLYLGFHSSLPFVGFGFLDNLVMIVAGEYIDHTIGATLAISTMAAAGLGNAISDVFGVASAWYVEKLSEQIGVKPPVLTIPQLEMTSARLASNLGKGLGVLVGCLIGMFPLLFYEQSEGVCPPIPPSTEDLQEK